MTVWTFKIDKVSVQFSRSVMSDSLWPHESQHARPPCPSPTPGVHPNPCPLSRWCHPTISFSVVPFSSCPQSFPASGYFQMSQLFTWGGQSIGDSASASVLPMNTQGWSLGWTGWISLQSKGLSRVFSSTTVQKHQFFSTQPFFLVQFTSMAGTILHQLSHQGSPQMWELDHKEGFALKNWCFRTVVLEKTLESPLDSKIKWVNPKANKP